MSKTTSTTPLINTYKRFPISVLKGKGSKVWDDKGEEFLDFTSGIATCNLGHVPEPVLHALQDQLTQVWHTSNLYHIEKQEKLAKLLINHSCFHQAFFCNSGAEANEAAIKLVRTYTRQKYNKSATIITFQQSFHGRTLATVSATGQEKIRTGFEPLVEGFIYLPYNDLKALQTLKAISPSAVMLELVQGEGGVIPADQEWVNALVEICKQNHILLVVDEVQTGMGRSGTLFAYEQYGIEPDIMTLAKGLGSGFPIGAMLATESVGTSFQPGSHGSTFGGNPLASSAGYATLEFMTSTNVLEHCQTMSQLLIKKLESLQAIYPIIKKVRGMGLLIGIEINGDALKVVESALKEKLLIVTAGPNVVRLLPPLNVNEDEIEEFFEKFTKVLKKNGEV